MKSQRVLADGGGGRGKTESQRGIGEESPRAAFDYVLKGHCTLTNSSCGILCRLLHFRPERAAVLSSTGPICNLRNNILLFLRDLGSNQCVSPSPCPCVVSVGDRAFQDRKIQKEIQ